MTDIVERLRENNELEWDYTMDLQEEAAAEIERLRDRIDELDGFIRIINEQATALEEDNRKLRVEAGYD